MSAPSRLHHHAALTPTALAITSHLLRHDNPNLASAIKHALDGIDTAGNRSSATIDEAELNAALLSALHAKTVGEILAALTELGQRALHSPERQSERVALLHALLDEWVALAEWILQRTEGEPRQWH